MCVCVHMCVCGVCLLGFFRGEEGREECFGEKERELRTERRTEIKKKKKAVETTARLRYIATT